MTVALLIIVAVAVTECGWHLPFARMTTRFAGVFPRALRAIRNDKVSDHWKERALLKLAKLSLMSSLWAAGAIFGLVALFIGGIYALNLLSPRLWDFALSIRGIIAASVAAMLYLAVRAHARSLLQRR